MPAVRTQIENGVVAALEDLLAETLGGTSEGYLRAIKAFNGESKPDFRLALGGRLPGVLVATARATYGKPDVSRVRATMRLDVDVYCCSNSMRSREARTQGAQTAGDPDPDPGIWALMEDVLNRLMGLDLGVAGAGELIPLEELPIEQADDMCVWRQRYYLDADVLRPAEVEEDLTAIGTRLRFPLAEETLSSGNGDTLTFDEEAGTVTLDCEAADFPAAYVGDLVKIANPANPANAGEFTITARASSTSITWQNADGISEDFEGTWYVRPQPQVTEELPEEGLLDD